MTASHSEELARRLGLRRTDPAETHLDGCDEVFIGARWDLARRGGRWHVYRKGNWVLDVGCFDLALAIVADGTPHGHCSGGCSPIQSGREDPSTVIQPLAPMVDDIGIAVIEHGERGYDLDPEHPEACLCGKVEPYYLCDGPGVESLTIRAADFGRSDEQGCLLRSEGTDG